MHALYLASVVIHILAAVTWIGGIFFLVLVVVPYLRRGERAQAAAFLRDVGMRFCTVGWVCFALLLASGAFNLWVRGVRWEHLLQPDWLASPFGRAVLLKLLAFALVLAMSALHDFVLGPRATAAVQSDPAWPEAERLRRKASWLGRATAVLAIVLVALGVVLVRGWP